MYSFTQLPAFLAIAIATTLSPGPAVLMSVRNGATHGFRLALVGICGNLSALLTYAAIATGGVAFLLRDTPGLVTLIQAAGGAYLTYLGVTLLRRTDRPIDARTASRDPAARVPRRRIFVESFLVGISNPKSIIFYAALFPQFIQPGRAVLPQAALLTAIFALCSVTALSMYAGLSSTAAGRFLDSHRLARVNRICGALFIVLGCSLVLGVLLVRH
jgi:threonine/homoserine/homoserine lactone efflux protein